jgi:hypothetical protein
MSERREGVVLRIEGGADVRDMRCSINGPAFYTRGGIRLHLGPDGLLSFESNIVIDRIEMDDRTRAVLGPLIESAARKAERAASDSGVVIASRGHVTLTFGLDP